MRIAVSAGSAASLVAAVLLVVLATAWLLARRSKAARRRVTAVAERDRRQAEQQGDRLRAELDRREERLAGEFDRLRTREDELAERSAALARAAAEAGELLRRRAAELERTAGLSAAEARAELVREAESEARREAAVTVREIERAAREEGEQRARGILAGAIQRLAADQTAETAVSVFRLPNEEMKGRVIGREGRNIRTFEAVTGVNLIIDDTPSVVQLSCFDPVRRETARLTLEQLVEDGRIHPLRIEHVHERSRAEIERRCVRAGEDALLAVRVGAMDPELVRTLGTLRYRASYGQNVLGHLVESAHLAGMMAAELGVDPEPVRRAALLHDIGKALTHEVEGSHAAIGADLARRFGESADVVHAIAAHHGEVEPRTVEAVLTQAADACSGARPGARKESLEAYVRRLERLEEIARAHEGVATVYAMQAGREVRVMVRPEVVDDLGAQVIAREVAKQVAEELTYPGQIRVTVVRESRATEVAR
ncbi:ribonuclease Y [Streptomyces sp. NRRL S-495]|uniref:ribonuclease Y n=1 Tax=Streptomyces sp. NRRL S-495 TaxID=1609133 RepID=UPI0005F91B47|nr:ribonuclease Y [Streptomyces sp. NRRL S-495]KJY35133.1 ribonuclease Y [Streptomyces sp. NRRL S-495]